MYDRAFDTDWESLTGEEAIRRMYALGVAAEMGYEYPTERRRIRELASSAYERSVLDLSFEEGQQKVADVRPGHDSDEAAWSELVEASGASAPSPESLSGDASESDAPDTVDRPGLLDGFDAGDLDRIRLPSLLRRDDE